MANDHRGRNVHAGKRTDDEVRKAMSDLPQATMKMRGYKPYVSNAPAYDLGEPDEAGEVSYRPESVMWDNPEYEGDD
jgi:hypothetical protein